MTVLTMNPLCWRTHAPVPGSPCGSIGLPFCVTTTVRLMVERAPFDERLVPPPVVIRLQLPYRNESAHPGRISKPIHLRGYGAGGLRRPLRVTLRDRSVTSSHRADRSTVEHGLDVHERRPCFWVPPSYRPPP